MLLLLVISAIFYHSECIGLFDTQSILEDAALPYFPQKTVKEGEGGFAYISGRIGGECFGNMPLETIEAEQTTDFLDMVNFMEFVQFTSTGRNRDFMNFYEIAKAAMDSGNTFLAQEHMARALRTIENTGRKKRNTGIWDAGTLFDSFREEMGEENFKKLLHLDRKVVMAFVVDTSSSMANDMIQVKAYIRELVMEQERSGVRAEYTLTTFADPYAYDTITFRNRQDLLQRLETLRPSIGGDCEERTCSGIKKAMFSNSFLTVRNSAMYVFTDAHSKDCLTQYYSIQNMLQLLKASAFFILFGTCRPDEVDTNYVSISDKSGGFTLLVKENGIYNITDTVNGAFSKDSLICGEESDNSLSVIGQGYGGIRKKRSEQSVLEENEIEYEERSIIVDTSIERFSVFVTATPVSLLSKVKLETPSDGDTKLCGLLEGGVDNVVKTVSMADDALVIGVTTRSCPCTGTWTLKYPKGSTQFKYKVRSSGEYLVDFESYFVDTVDTASDVANYRPCLGIIEKLVIKLNQGEKVNTNTLVAKILGLSGNVIHWQETLENNQYNQGNNAFVVPLVIPSEIGMEGFRIVLEGELIDGTHFQRISSNYFYPTGSCLRVASVTNYYALSPDKKTYITLKITNNNKFEEEYLVTCSNSMRYATNVGGPTIINAKNQRVNRRRSNPVLLGSGHSARFIANVAAPNSAKLQKGRTVAVTCKVTSSTAELTEMILLTEIDRAL